MTDILSQDEINELLAALTSGQEAFEPKPEPQSVMEVRPYNFRIANKFSKEQIRMLRFIYENFAGRLSTFLSGTLRAPCEVDLVSVEEQTFLEYNNSLPSPAFLAVFDMPPLEGSLLLELSPSVSYEIISCLFGGKGQFESDGIPVFTEIEISILYRLVQQILSVMDESWERIADVQTSLERIETNSQFAQIISGVEPIAIITMSVKIGETANLLSICIPHLAVQPIAKQLAKTNWYDDRASVTYAQSLDMNALSSRITNTAVTLHALFNTTIATVQDVMHLQVGDVICIDHPKEASITVMVEHIPKFKAALGEKEHRLALKITDIVKEDVENG